MEIARDGKAQCNLSYPEQNGHSEPYSILKNTVLLIFKHQTFIEYILNSHLYDALSRASYNWLICITDNV